MDLLFFPYRDVEPRGLRVKFLTDYPTLLKLQQAFPGIAIDEGFLTMANAKYALEVAVADVHLSRLLQKYPHQEVLFGLRILLVQAKGQIGRASCRERVCQYV